jgi:hypothetical protein
MLYQTFVGIGAVVVELGGEIHTQGWENCVRGKDIHGIKPVLMHFLPYQVHRIHWEHVLELVLSTGVTRINHWPAGW